VQQIAALAFSVHVHVILVWGQNILNVVTRLEGFKGRDCQAHVHACAFHSSCFRGNRMASVETATVRLQTATHQDIIGEVWFIAVSPPPDVGFDT
jgi:hypothetical protein